METVKFMTRAAVDTLVETLLWLHLRVAEEGAPRWNALAAPLKS